MTTTLTEIVTLAERSARDWHTAGHVGPFGSCPRCEPERALIAEAREEIVRLTSVDWQLVTTAQTVRWQIEVLDEAAKAMRDELLRVSVLLPEEVDSINAVVNAYNAVDRSTVAEVERREALADRVARLEIDMEGVKAALWTPEERA